VDDTFIEIDNRETAATMVDIDLSAIHQLSLQWLVSFCPAKIKSLIISNKRAAHLNPPVHLNGQVVEEVKSHTHLGVKLSYNLRWNNHINDITIKARKRLNSMVHLKYKLDRKTLETMYQSYVRPTMEYAQVVWGGTYDSDMVKLEKIQIDALRLVTGATAKSNIANLYRDTHWMKIQDRANNAVLAMMYKIFNDLAPSYLTNLIRIIDHTKQKHNLRQKESLMTQICRVETFRRSFFIHGVILWNNLSPDVIDSSSLEEFKLHLIGNGDPVELYYYGERWPSVHHARMRIGCSKLNSDLCYNLHVLNNPACDCGFLNEDAHHYFFTCPLHQRERITLFRDIRGLVNPDIKILLFGSPELTQKQNQSVFDTVHTFIKDTIRFDEHMIIPHHYPFPHPLPTNNTTSMLKSLIYRTPEKMA
jgi:hypothetical protein